LGRIADLSLAQSAYQLADEHRLWLPGMDKSQAIGIPVITVAAIGETGPIHRDINGKNPDGSIRGPFSIKDAKAGSVPTYPALWAHDAKRDNRVHLARAK
jgi:hypothetical protein